MRRRTKNPVENTKVGCPIPMERYGLLDRNPIDEECGEKPDYSTKRNSRTGKEQPKDNGRKSNPLPRTSDEGNGR